MLWGLTDLFYRMLQLDYNDMMNTGNKYGEGRRRAWAAFYRESGYQYYSMSDAIKSRNEVIIDEERKVAPFIPSWYEDWE